ncbi:MAG TPA: DUF6152 family protein [Alphaproteobacteria bacterium]|nr:DUF6152 family protein [Alphaproteobacteria bacterium]
MRRVAACALVMLLAAGAASAHHGWSGYDTQIRTLAGTVESLRYESPHVMLGLKAADGSRTVVLAPPSRMQARGLPDGAIKVGDAVTVEGYAHRTETQEMRAERIRVGDGQSVELR